jgi:hypothetical protein
MRTLESLYAVLRAERGPLAEALFDQAPAGEVFTPLVARGPRTCDGSAEYALLVESILEGYLLHYARGRLLHPPDEDLRLLCGDYLYALGLEHLAQLGDLDAVGELADLITLCAQLHAAGGSWNGAPPWPLAGAVWGLSVLAVVGGAWGEHREAKAQARAGSNEAAERSLHTARRRADELGMASELERALIAFDYAVEASASTT